MSRTNSLNPNELGLELKKGNIRPIYLIAGPQRSLITKMVGAIHHELQKKFPCAEQSTYTLTDNIDIFVSSLEQEMMTQSLFAEGKLIVCRNDSGFSWTKALGKRIEQFVDLIKGRQPDTVLVLVDAKIDSKSDKQVKEEIGEQQGAIIEANEPSEEAIRIRISKTFSSKGMRISADAITELLLRNENKWDLIGNEVAKIVLYAQAKGLKQINLECVELLCDGGFAQKVFDLGKLAMNREADKAYALLDHLMALGVSPIVLFKLMSDMLRQLLLAKLAGNAEILADPFKAMHPFVKKQSVKQAEKLKTDWLNQMIMLAADLDFRIKSGQLDQLLGVELLLARMSGR